MSDDDEISILCWPEYTEEDFREIDRLCEASRQNDVGLVHGAPSSSTELLRAADDGIHKIKEEIQANNESPFAQFREKRGYFSVTDLVSPAWCEVQFDYGLRQLRSKPVEKRPESFVSSKGKTINVKKKIAVRNEIIMDKGKTVHRKLEREIHKEEVRVKVKTKEEMWALHLIDFLVRLKSGKTASVCREIPVWGIINDQAIFGIVDELRLETHADASAPASGKRQTQTKLDPFSLQAKDIMHASTSTPRVILHIIDNKTRRSPYLPSHVDTLPSRLQIMLYWLLLNQALSRNGPGFSSFCARTGADPSREFSENFVTKISALVLESELSLHFLDAKCLQDMDFPYRETIKDMGLDEEGCISESLSLVYRLRGRATKKSRSASAAAVANKTNRARAQDQLENSVAVKKVTDEPIIVMDKGEGKLPPPTDGTVESEETVHHDGSPKTTEEGGSQVGAERSEATASSSRKRKRQESRESSASSPKSTSETPEGTSVEETGVSSDDTDTDSYPSSSPFILGTKEFQYNEILLNAHLTSILAWWHGKRPPHGVSIEDVGRCNSCEYKSGCEWREQKALEFLEKARAKSTKQVNGTVA